MTFGAPRRYGSAGRSADDSGRVRPILCGTGGICHLSPDYAKRPSPGFTGDVDVDAPALAIALIVFQLLDAIACIGPVSFIRKSLDQINCPESIRKLLPFVKFDSAVGLAIGLWVPWVGAATIVALIAYFCVAIWFHIRARDTIANSLGAMIVMGFVILVGVVSYFPAV